MLLWLSVMKRVNPQTSIDSNSTFCLWAPPLSFGREDHLS